MITLQEKNEIEEQQIKYSNQYRIRFLKYHNESQN